jgi:cytochrome c
MNVKTMIAWIIIVCALFAYGCTELIANDKIFNKCKACHGFEKNKLGPHLKGIIGRNMASVEGYKYSKALKDYQGFVWDEVNLSIWLQNPKKMIPRTKMMFPGIKKKAELDQLIEYLKTK